jgi:hypothetical protein
MLKEINIITYFKDLKKKIHNKYENSTLKIYIRTI